MIFFFSKNNLPLNSENNMNFSSWLVRTSTLTQRSLVQPSTETFVLKFKSTLQSVFYTRGLCNFDHS